MLKDRHESKTTDNTSEDKASYDRMRWDETEDEKLRGILSKVIHISDITIEIVGAWVWISGNTYSYRKELKDLGFKFAGTKKMWYWHSEAFRKKSKKSLSMDDIRNYYGSTEIKPDERKKIATA